MQFLISSTSASASRSFKTDFIASARGLCVTKGIFDPVTQRRTANVEQAVLLPAAETLPHLAPGGLAGLLKQLDQRSAAAVRDGLEELAATLRQDREALEEGRSFPAADRYLPLIYP